MPAAFRVHLQGNTHCRGYGRAVSQGNTKALTFTTNPREVTCEDCQKHAATIIPTPKQRIHLGDHPRAEKRFAVTAKPQRIPRAKPFDLSKTETFLDDWPNSATWTVIGLLIIILTLLVIFLPMIYPLVPRAL